jgi:hypothetical protein
MTHSTHHSSLVSSGSPPGQNNRTQSRAITLRRGRMDTGSRSTLMKWCNMRRAQRTSRGPHLPCPLSEFPRWPYWVMRALSSSLREIVYSCRKIPCCRAEKVWEPWVHNNRCYVLSNTPSVHVPSLARERPYATVARQRTNKVPRYGIKNV